MSVTVTPTAPFRPAAARGRFIDAAARLVLEECGVEGLFLAGSLARGDADEYSDVDLVIVCAERIDWRARFERRFRIVAAHSPPQAPGVISFITEDWLRCDVSEITADVMVRRYRRPDLVALHDPQDLLGRLDAAPAHGLPDPARIADLIREFIRVLGLLAVAVGRDDDVLAVSGAGLLRTHLIALLVEAGVETCGRRGALSLIRSIDSADYAVLRRLSPPYADRASVLAAHRDLAELFLPRARAIAADLNVAWPGDFEAPTLRRLQSQLGLTIRLSTEADAVSARRDAKEPF